MHVVACIYPLWMQRSCYMHNEYSVQYYWGLLVAKWLKCWTVNSGCSLTSRIYSKVHALTPTLKIEKSCAVGDLLINCVIQLNHMSKIMLLLKAFPFYLRKITYWIWSSPVVCKQHWHPHLSSCHHTQCPRYHLGKLPHDPELLLNLQSALCLH